MPGNVDSSFCIWLFIMPRENNVQKARAIGHIEAGMLRKDVAEKLGLSPGTITKWKNPKQQERTLQQHHYIRVLAVQDRRRTSQSIQRSVVRRYNTRVSD